MLEEDGVFGSYCLCWADQHSRVGHFEPVGTRADWRGKGAGRSVILEGLRRLGCHIDGDEADAVAHVSRAMAYGQGVVAELQADTHDEALDLFHAALTSARDDLSRATRMRHLGDYYHSIGSFEAAAKLFSTAMGIRNAKLSTTGGGRLQWPAE